MRIHKKYSIVLDPLDLGRYWIYYIKTENKRIFFATENSKLYINIYYKFIYNKYKLHNYIAENHFYFISG